MEDKLPYKEQLKIVEELSKIAQEYKITILTFPQKGNIMDGQNKKITNLSIYLDSLKASCVVAQENTNNKAQQLMWAGMELKLNKAINMSNCLKTKS